jgi:uncharacterized damage-inducible protein DinB
MNPMIEGLQMLLVRELNGFAKEIEMFPDDELMWTVMPGVTNSAANLAWHVCGNLQHFVGAVLGGTGYVRNREAEFGRRTGSRAEIVEEFQKTIAVIERVLPGVSDEALARNFPIRLHDLTLRTDRFLLHLLAHLAHHLGQAGYLRRMLTGGGSSAPLPLGALVLGRGLQS